MSTTIHRLAVDPDAELLEALRGHQATAAERLIAVFGARAYRLAIGITGNQQDAEEAVQDALWNVVRKIDTFRGESSLGSWIYQITANASNEKRRRGWHRRDEISLDEDLPSFDENGHRAGPLGDWSAKINDPAMQSELRSVLVSTLEELPGSYRAVIVLHDVEGLSMTETADCLGISVGTAK